MYKLTISTERSHKVYYDNRAVFEVSDDNYYFEELRTFYLYEYKEAIEEFKNSCKLARSKFQKMKDSAPEEFKDSGVVVTLSLEEFDNMEGDRVNEMYMQLEVLDTYEYTCDDYLAERKEEESEND